MTVPPLRLVVRRGLLLGGLLAVALVLFPACDNSGTLDATSASSPTVDAPAQTQYKLYCYLEWYWTCNNGHCGWWYRGVGDGQDCNLLDRDYMTHIADSDLIGEPVTAVATVSVSPGALSTAAGDNPDDLNAVVNRLYDNGETPIAHPGIGNAEIDSLAESNDVLVLGAPEPFAPATAGTPLSQNDLLDWVDTATAVNGYPSQ